MAATSRFRTFLFTDIEGSTRLWEEHDQAMESVLSLHDQVVHDAVERVGGRIFKHTGDGMAVSFDTVDQAIGAALTAQLELARVDWGPIGTLKSRMGIHAGSRAQARDGDYFGRDVNRCARLMSAAHGGQVVLSSVAVDRLDIDLDAMASDDLQWTVRDLGTHRLKDLSEPEHVYQLCHPQLGADFAPLATIEAIPRQLPDVCEFFDGRSVEIERLQQHLDSSRLVTVSGPGGVGKTQVALATAAEVLARFRDGTWFCEIADDESADDLAERILSTVRLQATGGETALDRLATGLSSRRTLIVLDSVERCLPAVKELVSHVLENCAHTSFLCTSRELLHARHERAIVVGPLLVPPVDLESVAHARTFAVVRLFERRAQRAEPSFVLHDGNLDAVASICTQLDGLPLAVDLAAAQMSALDPRDLADRVGRRVALIDDRNETLRTVIDWSFDSLSERERVLFRRLAVFGGSFSLALAEKVVVGGDIMVDDVMGGLSDLVSKSVLSVDRSLDGTRYHMLEILRSYAHERLREHEDPADLHEKHLAAFLAFAKQAAVGLTTAKEAEWVERMSTEFSNLRVAFNWAISSGDVARALELVHLVDGYARPRFRSDLDLWASQCIEHAAPGEPLLFAAHTVEASVAARRGDFEAARASSGVALELVDGSTEGQPFMAYRIGAVVSVLSGNIDHADEITSRALARAIDLGQLGEQAHFTAMQALTRSLIRGDSSSHELALDALDMARDSHNPSQLAWCLYVAGISTQDDEASLALLDEAIEFAELVDNRYVAGNALQVASWKRRSGGPVETAFGFERVIRYWYRIANWTNLATSLRMCAESVASIDDHLAAVIDGFLRYNDSTDLFALTPDDRYANLMDDVATRVGAADFAADRRRGATMDAAQMVTYCTGELAAMTGLASHADDGAGTPSMSGLGR